MKIPDLLLKPEFWVECQAGRTIFAEGDPGDSLFVLMEGRVEVTIKNRVVGTFEPIEILGEMALIDRQPRSATLKAKTKCKLARIDEDRFQYVIQHRPEFALEIMRSLAERIRWKDSVTANAALANASPTESMQKELQELKTALEALVGQVGKLLQKSSGG